MIDRSYVAVRRFLQDTPPSETVEYGLIAAVAGGLFLAALTLFINS